MRTLGQFTLHLSGTLKATNAKELTGIILKKPKSDVRSSQVQDALAQYVEGQDPVVIDWFTVDIFENQNGHFTFPDLDAALVRLQNIGLSCVAKMTQLRPQHDKNTICAVITPEMKAPRQIIIAHSHCKLIPAVLAQDPDYMNDFTAGAEYLDFHKTKKLIYKPTAHDLMLAQADL